MASKDRPSAPATLRELVDHQAHLQPAATYALFPETGQALSYARLAFNARHLATFLAGHGVRPGQRIAFLLPNGLQAVNLFIGLQAAGAVAVPLSLLARPTQLAWVLEHAGIELVFTGAAQRTDIDEAATVLGRALHIITVDADHPAPWEHSGSGTPEWAWPAPDEDADSLLMYTSGTTGRPKGVRLTQRNLLAGARFVSEAHALGPDDRVLAVLPLYHINAQVVTVLAPLWHGGSLAMPQRFSARAFWHHAAAGRCTWLNVVPTMVAYLLAQNPSDSPGGAQGAPPRFCRSASAPLPPAQQRAFEQRFGVGIIETMGLTETAAPCFTNPLDPRKRRLGSVGLPFGNEARIASLATGEALEVGVVGEIQIRGENLTPGYLDAPQDTASTFTADGWLRTGDLGYRDAEGYYFVTGRLKELIIKGGENIAPREVDEALLRHPAVLEAAAVGAPDDEYGQEVEAAVVLRPGAACTEQALQRFCAEHIGPFKTPRRIRFVSELPKGPSGKVQRLKLLESRP